MRLRAVLGALALALLLAGCGLTTVTEEPEVPVPEDRDTGDTAAGKPETGTVPEEAAETETASAQGSPALPESPVLPQVPAASEPGETVPERAAYVCYDGLYSVDYDPRVFTPGPAGGADLVRSDGTAVFFARLASPELTETWLAGMDEKSQYQVYLSFEGHTGKAAGCPFRAIVYQDETAWHAEAVVELGRDRGTEALPMYAVYFTCDGPSRQAVWTDGVETFLASLRLGEPGRE